MKQTFKTSLIAIALFCFAGGAVRAETKEIYSWSDITPAKLGTAITQADKGIISISSAVPTTINLGTVDLTGRDLGAVTLQYSAQLKAVEIEGTAFLEMWLHFPGEKGGNFFSRGLDNQLTKAEDWKGFATPFFLKEDQKPDRATLNLVINGHGTVLVKDVKLQY
jgi:hypothetical protein